MESIKITPYETSDSNTVACVIHCLKQKVSCNKGLIICADKSGSMNLIMDGVETTSTISAMNTIMSTPQTVMTQTPYPTTPYPTTPYPNTRMFYNSGINPNSRLGCVKGFLERIIDMYEFIQETQEISPELTIVLFDDNCDVFSTIDGCSYKDMKRQVNKSLLHNGGTNFDIALKTIDKYRSMSQGELEIIFLSDGSHCNSVVTKEDICKKYASYVDLAIGVGERGNDFDEKTLRAISKEFVVGDSSKRIRDVVAERSLGIITMLGKNLVIKGSNIVTSNMKKQDSNYEWPEMSMLMELYFTASRDSTISFSYTLQSGEKVVKNIDLDKVETIGDTAYGDKIVFCLGALQKLELAKEKISELSLPEKIAYLEEIEKEIGRSKHLESFKDTRLGIYLQQIKEQLDKILITRDEQKFLDLADNIQSDAYRSTSAITSQVYFSPQTTQTSQTTIHPNTNKCVICGDENAHREVVYVPCGHFITCSSCSVKWNARSDCCPYCNQKVTGCIFVKLTDEQKADSSNMMCPICNFRRINMVSEQCKHAFSCSNCVSKSKSLIGSVYCDICSVKVEKVIKIFI